MPKKPTVYKQEVKGCRMNVLSLFDGMSCGMIALERAGIPVDNYYACEIDKYAIQISKKNHPGIIQLGDVKDVKAEDLPKIDLIIGGSPCQGFSFCGKQLNFKDPRSVLFFEYARLVKECKPKYFLLENVRMKQEYQDVISDMLGVKPVHINSADFSAQDRKRLYWTNLKVQPWTMVYDTVEHILEDEVDNKYVIEPRRALVVLDNEVKRKKIAYIGSDGQGNRVYKIHAKSICISASSGGLGPKTGLYAMPCLTPERAKKRQNGRRFKPPRSKFYTLTAQDRHGILTNHFIRRLTPLEAERLQTLPDNYTEGVSDSQRYKMIGNGWTVDVIAHIFKSLKGKKRCKKKKTTRCGRHSSTLVVRSLKL